MFRLVTRVAVSVALLSSAVPAFAWGPVAHDAVARVAAQRLTPAAQKEVSSLLGGQSMSEVAVWADEVRNTTHTQTTAWHFTNIPLTSAGFSRSRDCQQGNCIVAAIERQLATLQDRNRPRVQRQEALKFLIHFIGDLHQPLHASDSRDRGGNDRMVAPVGGTTNLHAAWDSGIVQSQGRTSSSLAANAMAWLQTQRESDLITGTFADWANESLRLARDIVYVQLKGDNAIVGGERQEAVRIIEKRLARAGVRLAHVLNRAFAPPVPPAQ